MKIKINPLKINPLLMGIVLGLIIWSPKKNFNSKVHLLKLPSNKEMLAANDSIHFKYNPFNAKTKVVTYLKDDAMYVLPQWIPYIKKYPNVSFIFYVNSTNKEYVIGGLKYFHFPLPVFINTNSKYNGYGLICFVVDNQNKIIDISNPSMPNFNNLLKTYGGKKQE